LRDPYAPVGTVFPCTTLFRSVKVRTLPLASLWRTGSAIEVMRPWESKVTTAWDGSVRRQPALVRSRSTKRPGGATYSAPTLRNRSEEHTSELQSRENLVCRLL